MQIRTVSVVVAMLATIAAGCAAGESAVPGAGGSPDLPTADSATADADTDTDATVSLTTPAELPTDETTPTSPVTVVDVTTPALSGEELIIATCNSLTNDGYETRKRAREALAEAEVAAVQAACGDAFDRLDGALTIERRVAALNAGPAPLSATDLACDAGNFALTITNNVDHPIGVHASMRLVRDGAGEAPVGSTRQPLVIWSLEPGDSMVLADKYIVNRGTDEGLTCEVAITTFDATPGDADASLGEASVPELAADDPSVWLPFLVAQGSAIIGSGDTDLAAVVEDIRSTDYARVVELTQATDFDAPPSGTISICTASITQPDDRHMSVVFFDQGTDSAQLQHGVFRRGNDNQWRWLGSSVYFDSQDYWNCGTPTSSS